LGRREPTLAPLTEVVVREMGPIYPELVAKASELRETTGAEEERFLETIAGGLDRLEEVFATGATTIAGDEAFKLYDTFGFPIDLTQIIAGERGVTVDLTGFERALEAQRERSRAARRDGATVGVNAAQVEEDGAIRPRRRSSPAIHAKDPTAWRTVKRGKQRFV